MNQWFKPSNSEFLRIGKLPEWWDDKVVLHMEPCGCRYRIWWDDYTVTFYPCDSHGGFDGD